jgi:hypothetical protein
VRRLSLLPRRLLELELLSPVFELELPLRLLELLLRLLELELPLRLLELELPLRLLELELLLRLLELELPLRPSPPPPRRPWAKPVGAASVSTKVANTSVRSLFTFERVFICCLLGQN